jgi:cbb3-type cytochrome oxidase cytochrome c subunit
MPVLRKGAELFMSKACYGCHKVNGVSAGKLGVELSEVGNKWSFDYLRESLTDPKANNIESLMPAMDLTEDEIEALVVYLKSLTGENLLGGPVGHWTADKAWKAERPAEVEISVESGREVYYRLACDACHAIDGQGGQVGPDHSVIGLMRTREWLVDHNINPRVLVGGSSMPDFQYAESELEALALFLSSLTGEDQGAMEDAS